MSTLQTRSTDSGSRSRRNAEDLGPLECPSCKEITLEFVHYSWDDDGKEFEFWKCSSCGQKVNF